MHDTRLEAADAPLASRTPFLDCCCSASAGSGCSPNPPWAASTRIIPTIGAALLAGILLLVWFAFFSRLSRRLRMSVSIGVLLIVCATLSLVRVRGLTGDWVPILVFRWESQTAPIPTSSPASVSEPATVPPDKTPAEIPASTPTVLPSAATLPPIRARREGDFPQFLGPGRDGRIRGLLLARDWVADAPRRLWRQPIGEGWSGFAVAGDLAVTQEQRGGEEKVVAYDLLTGRVRWSHADTVQVTRPSSLESARGRLRRSPRAASLPSGPLGSSTPSTWPPAGDCGVAG